MSLDFADLLPELFEAANAPPTREERIEELTRLIADGRNRYYNNIEPIPSDEDYDAWTEELAGLEANNPALLAIGAVPISDWPKVSHGVPMGSLDKVKNPAEMAEWITGTKLNGRHLFVTEKLDGISIHVKYANGKYLQAMTRGDGTIGEDITPNVAKMKGVPATLTDNFTGSIRGEIILLKSDLAAHFPEKKNPRNAASGIAKRFDGVGVEHLTVMFYQVVDSIQIVAGTYSETFEYLRRLGLTTPPYSVTSDPTAVWDTYQAQIRSGLDYDIDGLVVRVNEIFDEEVLGESSSRPNGARAYKFDSVKALSTLRHILTPTGNTGRITPVGVVDPVNLMGATVTNASLYNWKYIQNLGLDIGARVEITRANDVIPRITKVTVSTGTIAKPPTHCESCQHEVVQEGEYYVCPNTAECPAQVVGRLQIWINELNVLDFGESLLEKVVAAGLVKSVPDLYRLTEEQIAKLDRVGAKVAAKVRHNLWEKNPLSLEMLLGGLSIPLIGQSTAKLIMDAGYDTLPKMLKAELSDFKAVKGVGPVKALSLYEWFHGKTRGEFTTAGNKQLLSDLFAAGVKIKDKVFGSATGSSFCFTGDIPGHSRESLQQKVLDAGGEVKSGVSKKLTYLVMADPNLNTTKAQAARKNGTKCIGLDEFLALLSP
jgi:DNA ligase (NAD+)